MPLSCTLSILSLLLSAALGCVGHYKICACCCCCCLSQLTLCSKHLFLLFMWFFPSDSFSLLHFVVFFCFFFSFADFFLLLLLLLILFLAFFGFCYFGSWIAPFAKRFSSFICNFSSFISFVDREGRRGGAAGGRGELWLRLWHVCVSLSVCVCVSFCCRPKLQHFENLGCSFLRCVCAAECVRVCMSV